MFQVHREYVPNNKICPPVNVIIEMLIKIAVDSITIKMISV